MKKFYIAFDGRAESGDTDEAQVFEAIGNHFTKKDYAFWRDHDAVLVQYDETSQPNGSMELINERIIGHWRMGFTALKALC